MGWRKPLGGGGQRGMGSKGQLREQFGRRKDTFAGSIARAMSTEDGVSGMDGDGKRARERVRGVFWVFWQVGQPVTPRRTH